MIAENSKIAVAPVALSLCMVAAQAAADYSLDAYAVSDVMTNVDGGVETGSAVLADVGVVFETEVASLFGENDAFFAAYLLWNNSSTFSDRYVGDLQSVSSIDTGNDFRIYEIWYQQSLGGDANVRLGLYDLNSEFDVTETSSVFVNGSHGIGAEYGQTGQEGPSIFPYTSLALRFEWTFREAHVLRYAIIDATPGRDDDPGRTAIHLSGNDGALHALEYDYTTSAGKHFGVGGWLYTADFELLDPPRPGASDDGNSGVYAFADVPVASWNNGAQLKAFVRYGIADDRFNVLEEYIGVGAVISGLLPSRPDDIFGLAVASGHIGSSWRAAAGDFAEAHETAIELTYSTELTDWLRIQPDIQYVINPGADRSLDNALVVGIRFELGKSFASD